MHDTFDRFNSRHCADTETLYQQGAPHPWVYWIEKGFVSISISDADGRQSITDLLGAGDFFGPGLFGNEQRSRIPSADQHPNTYTAKQTAIAKPLTDTRIIPAEEFWRLTDQTPSVSLALTQQMIAIQQRLQHQLFLQQTGTLEQRLAYLLHNLFDRLGLECTHGHLVDIRFSQQELASMVGGSRQTVSQILADWRRSGVIDYTRSYICLEEPQRLQQFAELSAS
ncbi:cAMP-activated global transcriptional regulator CRP [BD1-7 clade bacterium]|uniref:cAMP-activated global transcriptional regulator CRP n=1 Tax=BD1-7 clade bacterium TaxID=2029982 RepID=A0A5S9PEE7_9GAMM|nr:cAMP-activated global transcriptional regulator CRP [BD1-7 clade bacterium]